jgi:peptidoglycan/xylan/chitin deacetylase (PgdA/CDA1 family)
MIKPTVQRVIRQIHLGVLRRALPDKIALYFHELESVQRAAFCEMAGWAREQGYNFATDAENWLSDQGRAVWISFDDNHRFWYESLMMLDELSIKATFYTNTMPFRDRSTALQQREYYDRINYHGTRVPLSTEELREISAAGHIIGSHTHTHRALPQLRRAEAHDEIRRSKEILEDLTGKAVTDFSYPFGMRRHFSEALRRWCAGNGIKTIAGATPCMLHRRSTPLRIERHVWLLNRPFQFNLENIHVDGRLYASITGGSAVG